MTHVPFLQPTFPSAADVGADYAAILARGIFSNGGPLDASLVEAVEAWVGNGVHACTVSSGTAGLELAITATFDRSKPWGLVPAFTFAAGPMAVSPSGFQPMFLDADPDTWQPSLRHGLEILTHRRGEVGGILIGPTFGVADPAIDDWEAMADRFGLPLVFDSAAGFGGTHVSGEPLGSRGTCEVFSMHATKTLAVGEGGLITSRDTALIDAIVSQRNFGFDTARRSVRVGTNAKLTELAAAIGIRQMRVLELRVVKRRSVLEQYRCLLEPLGATFQPGVTSAAPPFVSALAPSASARRRALNLLELADVECRD
ncbi:MAG: DegT/DnrJ/EryC1/StrS family aminotransferase [Nocardioides sp.]